MSKSIYTTPELTRVGSFEEVTQGAASGAALDAAFPGGTPASDLTFSDLP